MLALLLFAAAAPAEDLDSRLRHLESAAAAWAPAPSPDGTRVAFLTTLFGTRQAASMDAQGGYPMQLTDEPGGALAVRYVPAEPRKLLIVAVRERHRRILLVDEDGAPPQAIDAAPGDQLIGGFARDGKKLFYAVFDGDKVSLRIRALDTGQWSEVTPPPASAGIAPPKNFPVALDEALKGLVSLGPPTPDGRGILAVVRRGGGEALVLVDVPSGRAEYLTPADKPARIRQPRFTRDSRTVYFLCDAGRKTLGVESIALQERARKTMYAPPQEIDAFAITEDGHRLAVAVESSGEDVFSLLELPSLRPQPLAAPPSGALAEGDPQLTWDHAGERLFFGWRLSDDTTDLWQMRLGYGTASRITRSPRPGLPRDAIPRPRLVRAEGAAAWLWKPPQAEKPPVAVLLSAREARPVFDKRIAALNFAGVAVLAVDAPDPETAALGLLRGFPELDSRAPLLLNFEGRPLKDPGRWGGVVGPGKQAGLHLDIDQPDLAALVKYARRAER